MLMTISHFPDGGAQALSESITCPNHMASHGRLEWAAWSLTSQTFLSPILEHLLLFFFDLKTIVFLNISITFSTLKVSWLKPTRISHLWLPMTNPSFIVLHNSWHLKPLVLVIECLFPCLHCLVQQREMPVLTTDECHRELLRFSSGSFRNREKFTETPLSALSP